MAKNTERNRGVITKRGEGKYLVRVYVGLSPEGKRIYSSKVVHGTFLQCQKEMTKMLGQKDTGTFVPPSKLTVAEFLSQWLDTKVRLSKRSRGDYADTLKRYVLPTLGRVKLVSLQRAQVQSLFNTLATEQKLSPVSVKKLHAVLNQAMEFAVREGTLAKNPCAFVERHKVERKDKVIFSAADVQLFLERTAQDETWGAIWFVALTTGMRPQEYLALQWGDLDADKKTLTVQRAMREATDNSRAIYEVSPVMKTTGSKRVITLGQHTVDALLAHKRRSATLGGWMFPSPEGEPFRPRKAWGVFRNTLTRLNAELKAEGRPLLPVMKLYNMRHTHFSHLLANGVDVKSAQGRGGWSTATMLLDVYATSLPQGGQQMADVSDALAFSPVRKEAAR